MSEDAPLLILGNGSVQEKVPATLEALTKKNSQGFTPLHLAADFNQLLLIPKEFLTHATLCDPTTCADIHGDTPLHRAAKLARIDMFPKHLLTESTILTANHNGLTPLHYAARTHQLDLIPQLLNRTTLLFRCPSLKPCQVDVEVAGGKKMMTPLYEAATHGSIHQIPEALLTEEVLGEPVLMSLVHSCSWQGYLHLLPDRLLSPKYLLSTLGKNFVAIDRAAWNSKLTPLEGRLPPKTLIAIKNFPKISLSARTWALEELKKAQLRNAAHQFQHPSL